MTGKSREKSWLKPETIIAMVALAIALTGTAYAALKLPPKSVGKPQLRSKAVTTSKIAPSAVTAAQVADGSLTGADIELKSLGTVPTATNSESANNANAVGGHAASCPPNTILIRGLCYDSSPSGPVNGVKAAADKCAAAGGWLPTVSDLFAARSVLNLGDGTGVHSQFTDSYYANASTGSEPFTVVVNEHGPQWALLEKGKEPVEENFQYTCVYPLVR